MAEGRTVPDAVETGYARQQQIKSEGTDRSMMKILLTTLNAKYIHSNPALKYLYQSAGTFRENMELKEFTINNDDGYIYTELLSGGYDLICFSCYIWNIERILYLVETLKEACPSVKILLGGPEASHGINELLEENPAVDFILAGEGEESFPLFLQAFHVGKGYEDVPALSLRGENGIKIIASTKQGRVDFEKVPFLYEGFPFEKDKVLYYESTRGCPYQCAYCLSCLDRGVRALPEARVKRDLSRFLRGQVKQVKFIDRTFNYDRERCLELVRFLIHEDNGITNFHFELCGDLIDEEFLHVLKEARPGLFQFEIGVQSTNKAALTACSRRESPMMGEKIRRIRAMQSVHLHLDLIAGLPFEDYASFGCSFNDVYAMQPHQLQLGFLKLLKGTPLREKAEEYGYIYRRKAPYEVIASSWISAQELVQLKKLEAVLDLYFNRGGFSQTLDFAVEALFPSPFAFYEDMASFYYHNGYQHCPHKKEDLYRIFYAYACELERKGYCCAEKLQSLLAEDMRQTLNFDAVKKFEKKGWSL